MVEIDWSLVANWRSSSLNRSSGTLAMVPSVFFNTTVSPSTSCNSASTWCVPVMSVHSPKNYRGAGGDIVSVFGLSWTKATSSRVGCLIDADACTRASVD